VKEDFDNILLLSIASEGQQDTQSLTRLETNLRSTDDL
jgi:hypothetical protein